MQPSVESEGNQLGDGDPGLRQRQKIHRLPYAETEGGSALGSGRDHPRGPARARQNAAIIFFLEQEFVRALPLQAASMLGLETILRTSR